MLFDFIENINENTKPEDLLQKHLNYDDNIFLVEKIIGIGGFKIIYELRNLKTNKITNVLKVYRERLSDKRVKELREIFDFLGNKDVLKEHEYIYIGDWVVLFETHLNPPESENIIVTSNNLKNYTDPENMHEIISLLQSDSEVKGVELCEKMIKKHPLVPFYRSVKVEISINASFTWIKRFQNLLISVLENGEYDNEHIQLVYDEWSGSHIKIPNGSVIKEINGYFERAKYYLKRANEDFNFISEIDEEGQYTPNLKNRLKEINEIFKSIQET